MAVSPDEAIVKHSVSEFTLEDMGGTGQYYNKRHR